MEFTTRRAGDVGRPGSPIAAALMDRQFAEGLTPMAVALVARHGKLVWTHAVGDARPGGPPVTIDSVFPMASQTKPMTAAVIMALAERGMIGLTESASLTLPELADEHDEVMVWTSSPTPRGGTTRIMLRLVRRSS